MSGNQTTRGTILIVGGDMPRTMAAMVAARLPGPPVIIASSPRQEIGPPDFGRVLDLPAIPLNRRERRAMKAGK